MTQRLVDLAVASVQEEIAAEEARVAAKALRDKLAIEADLQDYTERINYDLDRLFCLEDDEWEPNFKIAGDLKTPGKWGLQVHSNRGRGILITDGQIKLVADEFMGRDEIENFQFHYAWYWGDSDCDAGACGWGTIGDVLTDLESLGRAIVAHGNQRV